MWGNVGESQGGQCARRSQQKRPEARWGGIAERGRRKASEWEGRGKGCRGRVERRSGERRRAKMCEDARRRAETCRDVQRRAETCSGVGGVRRVAETCADVWKGADSERR